MRRSVLVVVAMAFAGCSGEAPAPDEGGPGAVLDGAGQPILDVTPAGPSAPPGTDTLHLASATRLNATGLAHLTILATLSGAQPQAFAWNATLNGTGNVSVARLRLWVDLQSSALQPGVGGDPGCTAALTLVLTRNGTATSQAGGCASLGSGLIPPGEHLLEFGTPMTAFPAGAALAPGDKVLVQVAFGLSLPQGVGHVLGGGDRDSALTLTGLAEPVVGSL